MDITAAVVPEKFKGFEIRKVVLNDPRPDEVVVRIVASGMCQTDLHARDGYYPTLKYPAVFGHEGAGVVAAVGSAVRKVAPGDHVIISFPWCGACPNCRQHTPAYCLDARKLKSSGTRADGSTLMCVGDDPVYSAFFQQSSFGTHAISNERFVVKVRKRRAARPARAVRLQHPDRRRRGAQRDAAEAGRQLAWCSASARSACRA